MFPVLLQSGDLVSQQLTFIQWWAIELQGNWWTLLGWNTAKVSILQNDQRSWRIIWGLKRLLYCQKCLNTHINESTYMHLHWTYQCSAVCVRICVAMCVSRCAFLCVHVYVYRCLFMLCVCDYVCVLVSAGQIPMELNIRWKTLGIPVLLSYIF